MISCGDEQQLKIAPSSEHSNEASPMLAEKLKVASGSVVSDSGPWLMNVSISARSDWVATANGESVVVLPQTVPAPVIWVMSTHAETVSS